MFGILNIAFVRGYSRAGEKSSEGRPNKLALGCHGWVFGYDNDYANHHFYGVTMETRNREGSAWYSSENYRAIEKAQRCEHSDFPNKSEAVCDAILCREPDRENPSLPYLIEQNFIQCKDNILFANFPVFDNDVFENVCLLLSDVTEEIADCMICISDKAEKILSKQVPPFVKDQCGAIAKIHHRLDVAAFLLENMIEEKMLTVPDEKVPLCMWGVRN